MNLRPGHTKRFWWTAAALVVVAEAFVFVRSIPEKRRWAAEPVLTLDLPADFSGEETRYTFQEQPERLGGAVQQLAFAKGRCGVFAPVAVPPGRRRSLDFFWFEYDPGNPRFIHDVFGHLPEVCMSASGAVLKATHPPREIEIGGRRHRVLVLEFVSPVSSDAMWVFRFTWLPEGVPYDPYETAYMMRGEKFLIGLLGRPKPPARILLAGALGYDSLDEAWGEYERLLVGRLRIAPR